MTRRSCEHGTPVTALVEVLQQGGIDPAWLRPETRWKVPRSARQAVDDLLVRHPSLEGCLLDELAMQHEEAAALEALWSAAGQAT